KFTGVIDSLNWLKITKANLQTVWSALLQIFIIEPLAVSDTITLPVKDEKRYKDHIDGNSIGHGPIHRLMTIPSALLKRRIWIYFNGFHLVLCKISFRI